MIAASTASAGCGGDCGLHGVLSRMGLCAMSGERGAFAGSNSTAITNWNTQPFPGARENTSLATGGLSGSLEAVWLSF
jgi:hypothetical protein